MTVWRRSFPYIPCRERLLGLPWKLTSIAKSAFIFLATATPTLARSETFTCLFTEPWFTVTYSTSNKRVLLQDDASPANDRTLNSISMKEVVLGNDLLWQDTNGKVVARLRLTGRGSDGMSETLFPYEITTNIIGAGSGIGGCSTSKHKAKIQQ